MDLVAVATLQGPSLRARGLVMGAMGFLGAISFAAVRIIRDGGVDGWSVFWIVVAMVWALGLASIDVFANRSLARAARRDQESEATPVILFRVGQVSASPPAGLRTVNKGWITLGRHEVTITTFKGRAIIGRHRRQDVVSAQMTGAPKSYGVLTLTFADGSKFESIPVETGVHNPGLSQDRVSRVAAEILRWRQQDANR